jgi:hypothetical protein
MNIQSNKLHYLFNLVELDAKRSGALLSTLLTLNSISWRSPWKHHSAKASKSASSSTNAYFTTTNLPHVGLKRSGALFSILMAGACALVA